MTIAHTGIIVPQAIHAEVVAWYLKALAPLSYKKLVDFGVTVGLGDKEFEADWWVTARDGDAVKSHHAFLAQDRDSVDAFYKAAVEAGAKDNGAPGPRPHYGAHYYAAFVIDPAGNNIEAVCLTAPAE